MEILFCILCTTAGLLAGKLLASKLNADKADFDAAVEAMKRANRRPPVVVVIYRKGE